MPKEEESEGRDGEEGKGEGEKYGENNNENLIKMQERLTIDDQHYSNCQQQEQKKRLHKGNLPISYFGVISTSPSLCFPSLPPPPSHRC